MSDDDAAEDAAPRVRPRALAVVFGVGLPLLALAVLVHLRQGDAPIGAATILDALVAYDGSSMHAIVRHLRLPRALAGVAAGALFAVAGLLLQTVTRNPLAAPATLGVNAGAFLAVVASASVLPALSALGPLTVAFLGGVAAAGIVVLVAGGLKATPLRLALAGMAVAMALAAGAAVLQILYQEATAGLFFWGAGSLVQEGWNGLAYAAPRAGPLLLVALLMSRPLDLLTLGDDVARGLGQRVRLVRVGATLVAVGLAAAAIALTGPVGFVGLVAPHLVRLMGVRRHLPRILGSAVWGGALLVGADVVGRWLSPGVAEIPAGVVTALVGTPFLVYLARRVEGGPGAVKRPGEDRQGPASAGRRPLGTVVAACSAGLAGLAVLSLTLGAVDVAPLDLLAAVLGDPTSVARYIAVDVRLPRILVASLAGACLAVSGLLLQGVVRNPLAAPEVVGVMSGAGVGALTLMLAIPAAPAALVPAGAFLGAVAALAVVYAAAWKEGVEPERLALVGIGVAAAGTAITNLLVVRADVRLAQALTWLAGSTYAQSWGDLAVLGGWAALLLPVAWVGARQLDVLGLGDDAALGLGMRLEPARLGQLGVAVGLAAGAVAAVGTVGFVGLIAPHAARMVVGGRHRRLVPVAALLGAALLVGADLVGRTLLAPRQVPAGLVAAVIGAPYFVWLLRREAR